jgi:hypothetical protein
VPVTDAVLLVPRISRTVQVSRRGALSASSRAGDTVGAPPREQHAVSRRSSAGVYEVFERAVHHDD